MPFSNHIKNNKNKYWIVVTIVAIFIITAYFTSNKFSAIKPLTSSQKQLLADVNYYAKTGDLGKADETYKRYFSGLKNKEVLLAKSSLGIYAGNVKAACEQLGQLQQVHGGDLVILNNLAVCYVYEGNISAAEMAFDQAEKVDPTHSFIQQNKNTFITANVRYQYLMALELSNEDRPLDLALLTYGD